MLTSGLRDPLTFTHTLFVFHSWVLTSINISTAALGPQPNVPDVLIRLLLLPFPLLLYRSIITDVLCHAPQFITCLVTIPLGLDLLLSFDDVDTRIIFVLADNQWQRALPVAVWLKNLPRVSSLVR